MSMGEVFGYFRCSTAKYSKPQQRGLTFFYFMVYRHFLSKFNVGIQNENKSSVMSDIHWWSMRLSSKRKPIFTHSK